MKNILILSVLTFSFVACSKKPPPDLRTPLAQAQNKSKQTSEETAENKTESKPNAPEDLTATLSADLKPYADVINKIAERKIRVVAAGNAAATKQADDEKFLKELDSKEKILFAIRTASDQNKASMLISVSAEKDQKHPAVAETLTGAPLLVQTLKDSDYNVMGLAQKADPRPGKEGGVITLIILAKEEALAADIQNAGDTGQLPDPQNQQRGTK